MSNWIPLAADEDEVRPLLEQARARLAERRFREAEQLLYAAAGKDPAHAETFNLLGVSMELKGLLQEAASYFRAALSFDPGYVSAQKNLKRVTAWPYFAKGIMGELQPKAE